MRIVEPQPHHIPRLVQLSKDFAGETEWAARIPIGSIMDRDTAQERLFGPQVVLTRIAETPSGQMAGFIGVYRHGETVYTSYLVAKEYRRSGLARQLVEDAFALLPPGLIVEAWVGEFNLDSIAATPRLGFGLDRTLQEDGRTIYIFTRET